MSGEGLCRVWRRFRSTWGCFGARGAAVVAVVDDDVAGDCGGPGFATEPRGVNWEGLGRLGRVLDHRWRWRGWQSGSVKYTTRSNERVCPSLHDSVSRAVGRLCTSFATSQCVSEGLAVVCALDETLAIVSEVVALIKLNPTSCLSSQHGKALLHSFNVSSVRMCMGSVM